jgi:ferredoxin-NADP reductase
MLIKREKPPFDDSSGGRYDTSYRKELEQLASELEEQARTVDFTNDPKASEKHEHFRRQADVLRFIILSNAREVERCGASCCSW